MTQITQSLELEKIDNKLNEILEKIKNINNSINESMCITGKLEAEYCDLFRVQQKILKRVNKNE